MSLSVYSQENKATLQREARKFAREGNELFSQNNFTDAEVAYKKALEKDPNYDIANYNLGVALSEQNRDKEAIAQYEITAKMSEDKMTKSEAYHNIGNQHYDTKNYQGAVDAYKNSLRSNPNDDETRYNLALAQEMLEDQQSKDDENKDDKDNKDKQDQNKDKQDQQDKDKKEDGEDQKNKDENEGDKDDQKQDPKDQNKDQENKEQLGRLAELGIILGCADDSQTGTNIIQSGCHSADRVDQLVLDWSRHHDLRGVVFRQSSVYGGRQFATEDQGWATFFADSIGAGHQAPARTTVAVHQLPHPHLLVEMKATAEVGAA